MSGGARVEHEAKTKVTVEIVVHTLTCVLNMTVKWNNNSPQTTIRVSTTQRLHRDYVSKLQLVSENGWSPLCSHHMYTCCSLPRPLLSMFILYQSCSGRWLLDYLCLYLHVSDCCLHLLPAACCLPDCFFFLPDPM